MYLSSSHRANVRGAIKRGELLGNERFKFLNEIQDEMIEEMRKNYSKLTKQTA